MLDSEIFENELASLFGEADKTESQVDRLKSPGSPTLQENSRLLSESELSALLGDLSSPKPPAANTSGISEAELAALLGGQPDAEPWADPTLTGDAPGSSALPHPSSSTISENELAALLGGLEDAEHIGNPEQWSDALPPEAEARPAAAEPEKQLSQSEIDALLAKLLGG